MPRFVLDLFYLFRRLTNGYPDKRGLADCAQKFNVPLPYSEEYKHSMQQKAAAGGCFDSDGQIALMDYCMDDVKVTLEIFKILCPDHPGLWQEALLYGEYCKVVAREEHRGLPVDKPRIERLLKAWPDIVRHMVLTIPRETRFYDGDGHFSEVAFTDYLIRNDIAWLPAKRTKKKQNKFEPPPAARLTRTRPATDSESLKKLAELYPKFKPFAEVRCFLERMQVESLSYLFSALIM